jgi:hypothetical protein
VSHVLAQLTRVEEAWLSGCQRYLHGRQSFKSETALTVGQHCALPVLRALRLACGGDRRLVTAELHESAADRFSCYRIYNRPCQGVSGPAASPIGRKIASAELRRRLGSNESTRSQDEED